LGIEGEMVTVLSLDPNPPAADERAAFVVVGAERLENIAEHARSTPHFLGPLFPAVRCISTLPNSHAPPRPSDLLVSVTDGDGPSWHYPNNANDRDWIYPPFLGVYPAKGRAVPLKHKQRKPKASDSSRRGRSINVKLPDKTCRITSPVDSLVELRRQVFHYIINYINIKKMGTKSEEKKKRKSGPNCPEIHLATLYSRRF
jgi:hypothetical protein